MTKEQAISILKYNSKVIHQTINGETDPNEVEALDMAIKALEQPTTKDCLVVDDCVSRKAVLDCLTATGLKKFDFILDAREKVNNLPPVTPTFPRGATNGDVIRAMFPNIEADEIKTNTGGYIEVKYLDTTDKCDATAFIKNWWNAPYKQGDEKE